MKLRSILIAFLFSGIALADVYLLDTTKPKDAEPYFRIHRLVRLGFQWGFIDAHGKTLIEPRFHNEGYFYNGLARVVIGGATGFVNLSGQMAIAPRYQDARDFREDLAPVRIDRKWGYINSQDQLVIAPSYQGAASFREGLARVEVWEKIRCPKGSVYTRDDAPEYVYGIQSDIGHGMNNPCVALDSTVGFIDTQGHLAIPLQYFEAHDFSEGLAAVRMTSTGKYGFIDRQGRLVIDFKFDEVGSFSEGLAWARVGRSVVDGIHNPGSCGYIDHSGKFVIDPHFAGAADFSEGLASVALWDPRGRGFIDRSGKLVIPARYVWTDSFSEGLGRVCNEATLTSWFCIYIDPRGRTVISSFQALGPFSDGLALARELNGKERTVYIDKSGHVVAPVEVEAPAPERR